MKRAVLDALKREALHRIADAEDVTLPDRRVLDSMREALTSAKLSLETVLGHLTRDELKAVCRALGLNDGGREKEELRARVLASKGQASSGGGTPPPRDPPRRKGRNGSHAEEAPEPDLDGKLTLQTLEAHLWASADLLRGSIDAADFKNYIFGLLFLKRVSDVFEEEAEALERAGKQKKVAWDDPDQHRFFVPERARWSSLAKITSNIGEAIDKAVGALEDANRELEGVFGGISYNDKDKLPDTTLVALVRHFSKLSLRNSNLSDPDILGRAYEYLIAQFASTAGKKGGEFYTPKEVVRLLVEILQPEERMRVYDPCCGSGGMLIQAARFLKEHGKNPKKLSLFGQERNVGTWAICKMNLFLHDLEADIQKGDTLRAPKHTEGGALKVFDRVIANPPFSLKKWGLDECGADPYGRFRFGLPPASYGDLAFVQHMLASANDRGMIGTVMPHGVLYRGRSDERIRRGLVEGDFIEAIIGLAPNLFYGAGLPTCLLILNKNKPSTRRGRILLVDGAEYCRHEVNQDVLDDTHVAALAAAFHRYCDEPGFSRVVTTDDVRKQNFNLNLARYFDSSTNAPPDLDPRAELASLRSEQRTRDSAFLKWEALVETFFQASETEDWSEVELGDVFTQVVDRGHTDDLPVLAVTIGAGVVHRDSLERRMDREVEREEYLRVRPGDIVYNTMRMWQGASGLAREDGYVSPAYTVCRPGAGEVPEFWAHYFKLPQMIQRFRNYSQGIAEDRYRLYFSEFSRVPCLRPSRELQLRISDLLVESAHVLATERKVLEQLERLNGALLAGALTPKTAAGAEA